MGGGEGRGGGERGGEGGRGGGAGGRGGGEAAAAGWGRGWPARSPRAAASLPAGLRCALPVSAAPRLSRLPSCPQAVAAGTGKAHSGGSSARGLGCCVLGGGGSGGGSGPTRAVTIVRGGRRPRAEPLSSPRRRPWPPALVPPAPGALRRPPGSRALRLRAARPARSPAPRAPTLTHKRARGGFPRRPPVGGRETQASRGPHSRPRPPWRRTPRRHLYVHCDTRHSDTRAPARSPHTRAPTLTCGHDVGRCDGLDPLLDIAIARVHARISHSLVGWTGLDVSPLVLGTKCVMALQCPAPSGLSIALCGISG